MKSLKGISAVSWVLKDGVSKDFNDWFIPVMKVQLQLSNFSRSTLFYRLLPFFLPNKYFRSGLSRGVKNTPQEE